jgi:hypothetical protein
MITLAEPNPYLLAETEERPAQQDDRESKKDTGSVYVLQLEERAGEFDDKEQRSAHSAGKCQACCAVQKFGALPQARNIRLEGRPGGIAVCDSIQAADAVDDTCDPSQQDRDEAGPPRRE